MLLLFKDIQGHLASLDGSGTHCYDFLLIIIIITMKQRLISRGNVPGTLQGRVTEINTRKRYNMLQLRMKGQGMRLNQSIMLFRVVQVTKSLQDPLEVGNSLLGISDDVRE